MNADLMRPVSKVIASVFMLLGAVAVLTLGATPMAAMADSPPCHSQDHSPPADQPTSKALKVMNCCVACVTAPRMEPPASPVRLAPPDDVYDVPTSLRVGLMPSPAHGPPRA